MTWLDSQLAHDFLQALFVIVAALVNVAWLTHAERKILASMQLRTGPNAVGYLGVLQPLADALKLLGKELILPARAQANIFTGAPVAALFLSLLPWLFLPLATGVQSVDLNLGLLYYFAIGGLGVYPILTAGWGSRSIFPLLGGLRGAATMVSYELVLGVIQLATVTLAGSLSLEAVGRAQENCWAAVPLWPLLIMALVASLAETSRPPFDLTEGESELVAGFSTEYSGMRFSLFALTEYGHVASCSLFLVTLFFGGSTGFPLWLKYLFVIFFFIWARAAVPRYRVDSLMYLCWKALILISLGALLLGWGLEILGFCLIEG